MSTTMTNNNNTTTAKNPIIPPKFYQICRLCLALCSDSETNRLSIFNDNQLSAAAAAGFLGGSKSSSGINSLRSLQSSIIKLTNNANKQSKHHAHATTADDFDSKEQTAVSSPSSITTSIDNCCYDDDSDLDITNRILSCLSIEVSTVFIFVVYMKFCIHKMQWND